MQFVPRIYCLLRLCPLLASLIASTLPAKAADEPPEKSGGSTAEDLAIAMKKFRVAPGLKVDLFAAEPDVQNPVSFSFDGKGRLYLVETFRRRSSVIDIRGHKDWLEADLSFRTVSNRADFLRQQFPIDGKPGRGLADFNRDGRVDWRDLEVESERIMRLEDTNGDGRADKAEVFADGFNSIVSGVAAGVLAHGDDVYFACIPDLWKITNPGLRMANGLPSADPLPGNPRLANRKLQITNLLHGFGVHIAFGGHDMHGLIFGPDGKLYWSIADRGTDTNLFAKIKNPWPGLTPELLADSGCVFRCNPDGSEFEVVACGLRNPQELAFDESGNLFTADNNGDGGDKARWHYVVEGADFGWRIGWQWLPKMGPWNSERLWHLEDSNTAAYLLPPLAHIGHGPAGLAYNPGIGLPPEFARHFFLCDFPGSVLMWTNTPNGASFKAGPVKNFFGDLGPSDVAFGPDGGVYVSDWFKSFDKSGKGRIYRIHDPATDKSAAVLETKRLLAGGIAASVQRMIAQYAASTNLGVREQIELSERLAEEATKFFEHPDFRVRMEAQRLFFATDVRQWNPFLSFVRWRNPTASLHQNTNHEIACLQAVWSSAARMKTEKPRHPMSAQGGRETSLKFLSKDSSAEIRFHYANLVGECGDGDPALSGLLSLLKDHSPRVRFAAAMALGKWVERTRLQWGNDAVRSFRTVGEPSPYTIALFELLRSNADQDAYLRHAAVLAMARIGDTPALLTAANNNSPSVRLGVLLALRRLGSPEVARFLNDADPQIVLEAARAINDAPIPAALPRLAALLSSSRRESAPVSSAASGKDQSGLTSAATELENFTLRRALNANFRLGGADNAKALVRFAANKNSSEPLRVEALEMLAEWAVPPLRDKIVGLHRPLAPRDGAVAAAALQPLLAQISQDAPNSVRLAATRTATALGVKQGDSFATIADTALAPEIRAEALNTLALQKSARLPDAFKLALADKNEMVRIAALRLPGGADMTTLLGTLGKGSIAEKQAALASLATTPDPAADDALNQQLDRLLAGQAEKELQLDILEAAAKRTASGVKERGQRFEKSRDAKDALAPWRETLFGGNAAAGRKTFIERQDAACLRCHKVNGEGGEVGPELTGLGQKQNRETILESILFPNKNIAPGFENVVVELKNGKSFAGQVKRETATELDILSPEDGVLLKLLKGDIKSRDRGLSAMPEELVKMLSKTELRDLVEFLSTVK